MPKTGTQSDYVKYTLEQMDKHGIERGMIGVSLDDEVSCQALKDHPDRFVGASSVDPNGGMEAVRKLVAEFEEGYAVAAPTRPDVCASCHLAGLCRVGDPPPGAIG